MTTQVRINKTNFFVKNTKEQIASLFTGNSTANGTFKILKNRIMFYDMQGELFAALIKNKGDDAFFVNATKLENGKIYYQYSTGENQERKLGIAGLGFKAQREIAATLAEKHIA